MNTKQLTIEQKDMIGFLSELICSWEYIDNIFDKENLNEIHNRVKDYFEQNYDLSDKDDNELMKNISYNLQDLLILLRSC